MFKSKVILIPLLVAVLISAATFLLLWKSLRSGPVGPGTAGNDSGDPELIGGQRDVHGCLGPAGYSWDEDLMICARAWEIDLDKRSIVKKALEKISPSDGLTLIEIIPGVCPGGCYKVSFEIYGEQISVDVTTVSAQLHPDTGGTDDLKEGWVMYTDKINNFSVAHPESYKVTDDRYGWPNAVLILYNGGQSYDLVVEKWTTAQEYQNKYKNTKNLSVFKTSTGYLTAINQNFDPEVDEIIATLKVLE